MCIRDSILPSSTKVSRTISMIRLCSLSASLSWATEKAASSRLLSVRRRLSSTMRYSSIDATASLSRVAPVSYTHLRAHETPEHLVCRLLLEKKKQELFLDNSSSSICYIYTPL
eukprot:TRINITY_DN19126_c0_g2_i1.p1 TRINITY_DN19126_c0_g2~~TRINITY_DN19126_c0_g2_i1.p1  ORF type:complete len:114 (-),score=21.39 TRINITY_DN19126_c0_g2_i1:2-343(-)